MAAAGDETAYDVVPRLHLGDSRTDVLDDTRAFVSADDREARHQVAVGQMQIGVTQAGSGVVDQYFAFARTVEFELDDLEWLARPDKNRGSSLHINLLAYAVLQ